MNMSQVCEFLYQYILICKSRPGYSKVTTIKQPPGKFVKDSKNMKKYAKTSKTKLKKKGKVCETYTKLYISTKSTKKSAKECKV